MDIPPLDLQTNDNYGLQKFLKKHSRGTIPSDSSLDNPPFTNLVYPQNSI
ncbi:unnamed protein product [marine sediment metagenome]|uniref:Uncharacterized protein n=1 Tax=marine sediment metagenome TaxID=412755 RepID=X0X8Q9_9ZZZZ